jgi:hypothetical protein
MPEQVKVGTKTIMTYDQRLAFLRSSKLGQLFGMSQVQQEESKTNQTFGSAA